MIDLAKETIRVKEIMAKGGYSVDNINYGDKVIFNYFEKEVRGEVKIIDRNGGGIYYGVCPSVDVQGEDGVFYKHISIVDIAK